MIHLPNWILPLCLSPGVWKSLDRRTRLKAPAWVFTLEYRLTKESFGKMAGKDKKNFQALSKSTENSTGIFKQSRILCVALAIAVVCQLLASQAKAQDKF